MALELTPIIVASITGLGAGIIGSLVAPWAQWKIEEVRERTKERRKFLKSCRTLVSAELEKRDVFNSTAVPLTFTTTKIGLGCNFGD
jgi:hypothetical protein